MDQLHLPSGSLREMQNLSLPPQTYTLPRSSGNWVLSVPGVVPRWFTSDHPRAYEKGTHLGSIPGVLNKTLREWDPVLQIILMAHGRLKTNAVGYSCLLRSRCGLLGFLLVLEEVTRNGRKGVLRGILRRHSLVADLESQGSFHLPLHSHLIDSIQFSKHVLSPYTQHQNHGYKRVGSEQGGRYAKTQVNTTQSTGSWRHNRHTPAEAVLPNQKPPCPPSASWPHLAPEPPS